MYKFNMNEIMVLVVTEKIINSIYDVRDREIDYCKITYRRFIDSIVYYDLHSLIDGIWYYVREEEIRRANRLEREIVRELYL